MDSKFKGIVVENSETIVEMWLEEVARLKEANRTATISDDMYDNTNREFVEVIFTSIKNQGAIKAVETFSEKIISLGWPLSYITDGLQVFRRVTINFILSQSDSMDTDSISNVLSSVDRWVEPIIRVLVNEYTGNWENIVSLQRVALQELSAPLFL